MGKGLAKLASALGHSDGDTPDGTSSGHKKSLLGITDGMEEMSKGFIAMTGVSLLPVPGSRPGKWHSVGMRAGSKLHSMRACR